MAKPTLRSNQIPSLANPDPQAQDEATQGHLAANLRAAALTRLELAVMRSHEALQSSAVEIHKQVGGPALSWQDVALLHSVRLRGGQPTLTDMLVFLHRHDLASLQYSFRKLESLELVRKVRGPSRREGAYVMTETGLSLTDRHSKTRDDVTVNLCKDIVDMEKNMHFAASVLERLVGLYDQATQTVLNGRVLRDPAPAAAAVYSTRGKNARKVTTAAATLKSAERSRGRS